MAVRFPHLVGFALSYSNEVQVCCASPLRRRSTVLKRICLRRRQHILFMIAGNALLSPLQVGNRKAPEVDASLSVHTRGPAL